MAVKHIHRNSQWIADKIELTAVKKLSLVKQSGCHGIFNKSHQPSGDRLYFAKEPHVDAYPNRADINFIANSGTHLGADLNPISL